MEQGVFIWRGGGGGEGSRYVVMSSLLTRSSHFNCDSHLYFPCRIHNEMAAVPLLCDLPEILSNVRTESV